VPIRMKCKIVTFKEVREMVKQVSVEVKGSRYNPTTIIGLARGGWIPARLMCDFLGITDLLSLKVEHWLQTGKTKEEATIRYPLEADFSGKSLLVVDDITDTGKSLITSTEYLRRLKPLDIRTATMQYIHTSKFRPDYFAEKVRTWAWFIYPWNWIEDTSTLIIRLMGKGGERRWSLRDVNSGLKEFFGIRWNEAMLRHILGVMCEREQVELVEGKRGLKYRLKEERVIQL
jgi:hypoxanthine phosphoribosyltransferase